MIWRHTLYSHPIRGQTGIYLRGISQGTNISCAGSDSQSLAGVPRSVQTCSWGWSCPVPQLGSISALSFHGISRGHTIGTLGSWLKWYYLWSIPDAEPTASSLSGFKMLCRDGYACSPCWWRNTGSIIGHTMRQKSTVPTGSSAVTGLLSYFAKSLWVRR